MVVVVVVVVDLGGQKSRGSDQRRLTSGPARLSADGAASVLGSSAGGNRRHLGRVDLLATSTCLIFK